MKDADISSALGIGVSGGEGAPVVEEGIESALNRKKQLRRRQKRLDGEGEAHLCDSLWRTAARSCEVDPEGLTGWWNVR